MEWTGAGGDDDDAGGEGEDDVYIMEDFGDVISGMEYIL